MARRERAVGGPAERTFESLLGLQLRPRRMREAADVWESLGAGKSVGDRDSLWSHPDLLPHLPDEKPVDANATGEVPAVGATTASTDTTTSQSDATTGSVPDAEGTASGSESIDWDAELQRLLDEENGEGGDAKKGGAKKGDAKKGGDPGDDSDGDDSNHSNHDDSGDDAGSEGDKPRNDA